MLKFERETFGCQCATLRGVLPARSSETADVCRSLLFFFRAWKLCQSTSGGKALIFGSLTPCKAVAFLGVALAK